jgi:kynurenine formamidase
MSSLPDYDDLPLRSGLPCAWDVWNPGADVFGCLNLLTPERAADAARLVRHGAVFALNWTMALPNPPLFGRKSYSHEVTGDENTSSHDDVLHGWNTQSSSQWDGFRHIRNFMMLDDQPGTGHFGGVDDQAHGVHHWAQRGLVGRGVLADIGRWRDAIGRPIHYAEPDMIAPSEIAECLAVQGTELREGDVLLVRFGWVAWYLEQPQSVRDWLGDRDTFRSAGFEPTEELARTLWNHHIAAIACDNPGIEIWPRGSHLEPQLLEAVKADRRRTHEMFAHALLLPMLGLPLGEMFALDALAADCAADGCYEFLFTSAPLNLPSGVASPPNALAIK